MTRRRRTEVDLADLRHLSPTRDEWLHAIDFVVRWDGTAPTFELDLVPVLESLNAHEAIAAWRAR